MYEIRPETAKTFITDRSISLPRFQRKQTWDEKKNFQLCISVFKGYPMGVCIINTEKDGSKTKKYLLDGRQRRNALSQMYENPEVIGLWAKKFLRFKSGIETDELTDLFEEKINLYLEADDDLYSVEEPVVDTDSDEIEETEEDLDEEVSGVGEGGLKLLLQILLLTYKKTKHATGFTAPFDFVKLFTALPFVDADTRNGYVINGKK